MKKCLMMCAASILSFNASAVQVAGTLLVDLNAADVASVGVGNRVQNWQNNGTMGQAFTPAVSGQGPEFRTYGTANTPAVYFSGDVNGTKNSNSILTGPSVDPRITGTSSWTVETWINVQTVAYSGTYFSWTYRGSTTTSPIVNHAGPNHRLFEARYSSAGDAIEHHSTNVSWNNLKPPVDQWHHVVLTRNGATRMEHVYVDGIQVNALERLIDILPDGIFIIGATQNSGRNGWDQQASAYIGQIRVHTDFMPQGDAIANYMAERAAYGVTSAPASVWDGTPATLLPWETPLNWIGGTLPTPTSQVAINNGGIAHLTTPAGLIRSLAVTQGGLSLSNNASLEMLALSSGGAVMTVAGFANSTGTVNIAEGRLSTRDNSIGLQITVGDATNALGTVIVGGGPGALPARFEMGRDPYIGRNRGAEGHLIVQTNGTVALWGGTSGYIYVGQSFGVGTVTVNGGSINPFPRITLVNNGGKATLTLNDGFIRLTDLLNFSAGTAYADSEAIFRLNGGVLQTPRINMTTLTGTNAIYFNGGTLRNVNQTQADFIGDTPSLFVQAGGAVFDIIENLGDAALVTEATMQRGLKHDPALGATKDGGLIKRGPGVLRLTGGAHTFTGDIRLEGGMLFFERNDLLPGYAGKVRFANPNAVVGANFTEGVAWILPFIANDADGYFAVFPANAGENIDLTNHPDLKLAFRGTVTYTGTITLSAGAPLHLSPLHQAVLTYTQPITGGTSLVVDGQGNGTLVLATANNYTGGTLVKGGKIRLDSLDPLGSGPITLDGGALVLNADNFNAATLLSRITQNSRGYILLTSATTGLSFDLSQHPGIRIGTDANAVTYSGANLTPNSNTYRFGGGWTRIRGQGNTGLNAQNLTDNGATPRSVVIEGDGGVRLLNNGSTFTGPIAVTNKGGLYINNTAQNLGNATSLYFNDGLVRITDSVTVPSRVAVTVGPLGMEVNPGSSTYNTFAGPLSGSGRVWTTDIETGSAFFGDASAFTGTFDICRNGATLGVGSGNIFGWNKATPIVNTGTGNGIISYFGIQYDGPLTWSSAIGRPLGSDSLNLGLRKRGSGTLTVDVAQLYNGDTIIEQGTLKAANPKAVPGGFAFGNVSVAAGTVLDVNGHTLTLNALTNPGLVTNSAGGPVTLNVGAAYNTWTSAATFDPNILINKTGTGNMTMTQTPEKINNVVVEAGTVTLAIPAGIGGDITLQGSSTLTVNGVVYGINETQGLEAHYYTYAALGNNNPSSAMIDTFDALNNRFFTTTPTLVTNTTHAGPTLDFGFSTAAEPICKFPAPFDAASTEQFLAIYRGTFIAEETGTYTFGLRSDDRAVMYINGQTAVPVGTTSQGAGTTPTQGSLHLDAGEHDILIGFYEATGQQGLHVLVKAPSAPALAMLPQSLLRLAAAPSVRLGGLTGSSATYLYINGSAITDVGANAPGTTTFSGTVTNSPFATLRKVGPGHQILNGTTVNLGYVDPQEGILEIATPGNATAFVTTYLAASSTNTFSGVMLSSPAGGSPGSTLLLRDGSGIMMNRAPADATFYGSLAGPAQTVAVKADNKTLTLAGNNDAFLGTWIIHSGAVEVAAGGTLGTGPVINSGTLCFSGDEDYFLDLLAGFGQLVKRGTGTLYVRCLGSIMSQSVVIEGGNVVFDTQGKTIYLSKIPETAKGCSWSITGGGTVKTVNSGDPEMSHVIVDGTEWFVPAGSYPPVQEGLTVALDASKGSTLTRDVNGIVTQWHAALGAMAYTNDVLASCPVFRPGAFGGRGGIQFGTNAINGTVVGTRLSSTDPTVMKTFFAVNRLTGTQVDYAGLFGQTGADNGIRYQGNSTKLRTPGSGNDFINGTTPGRTYTNGVNVSSITDPDVGTEPFLLTQFAGSSNGSWNGSLMTSIGWYYQAARYFKGEVGELLVYNRTLTANEQLLVEAYLMDKWLTGAGVPEASLPTGIVIEVSNGGIVNLDASVQTVSTVIIGDGGGSVVNGKLIITDALIVNVKPDGTTDLIAFENVVFGPNAKLIINGMQYARSVIDLFTATTLSPIPPFDKNVLPKGWTPSYRNGLCRLSFGGMLIILR